MPIFYVKYYTYWEIEEKLEKEEEDVKAKIGKSTLVNNYNSITEHNLPIHDYK